MTRSLAEGNWAKHRLHPGSAEARGERAKAIRSRLKNDVGGSSAENQPEGSLRAASGPWHRASTAQRF